MKSVPLVVAVSFHRLYFFFSDVCFSVAFLKNKK